MIYLLQHALAESAQRDPDHPAVVFGDRSLAYGELDRRSNQLAHALRRSGVDRGDRVALLTGKSVEALVGVHGILKAAGAYVPLDPRAPLARMLYVMKDCGVEHLVVSAQRLDIVHKLASEASFLRTILVIGDSPADPSAGFASLVPWSEIQRERTDAPESASIETDLAYLLYTSGSTGAPKGVMISHLASLTFVRWATDAFDVDRRDRLSNHAPLHFDLSIFDLFSAMMAGATVLPVPDGTSAFPASLADWISENRISIWYSVPSILSMLVQNGKLERHRFENLRTVLFAGEVFPVKYLRAWIERIPHARIFNLYGPTETNVITYHEVDGLPRDQTTPIPIGRACANSEVFAVTSSGEIAAPGEEGELWARGSCLADGYWGDPERTASVFVRNPFAPQDPHRVYRTGDLVRLEEDGNYHFLGRLDHMIKRLGYRIELGEIESALYNHESVKEATVVAETDAEGNTRITAFVVGEPGVSTSSGDVERHLAHWLPKYMTPDEIVVRDSLPKTSTGKIDRRALQSVAAGADLAG